MKETFDKYHTNFKVILQADIDNEKSFKGLLEDKSLIDVLLMEQTNQMQEEDVEVPT